MKNKELIKKNYSKAEDWKNLIYQYYKDRKKYIKLHYAIEKM